MGYDFETQLAGFIKGAQKVIDDYMYTNFPRQGRILKLERGSKNIRVVAVDTFDGVESSGGSAWCFIEIATGNIMKPAGYKTPAKHARGNIMQEDFGVSYIGPYGPAYLKKGRK